MFKIFKYLSKKERLLTVFSMALMLLQVWLELQLPEFMQQITLLLTTPGNTLKDIWDIGFLMLLCALASFAVMVVVGFFASRIAASFSQRLRSLIFSKVDSFSLEEINYFSTSSLITRSTNDITQIQILLTLAIQLMVKAPVVVVLAITRILGKGLEWTLATGVSVLFLITVLSILMVTVMPKFKQMQNLTDNLNRITMENLRGLRVVRAYNAEKFEEEKFEVANSKLTNTQLFTSRGISLISPLMYILMSGTSLSVYWIGAYLINSANMQEKLTLFSNMTIFSNYAVQIIMSFMILGVIFVLLPRAAVSAKRILEVLNTSPKIIDGTVTEGLPGHEGQVEFRNVCFKYPEAEHCVLENISFKAKKGQTIAFIGSTGSGKSTLINLIPRFFEATKGEIFVSGVNVKDYKLKSLYNKIGYVSQKAVLFMGDINLNVAYGEGAHGKPSDDDIKLAVKTAQAQNFVEKLDGGYQGNVAQAGSNFSGGQKQRLSIARAIARKPELYIFDDSFSALDYKTDKLLRTAIKKETSGITNFIVAQRIGTIIDADKIIVLDEGRIVGKGKHKDLLETCQVYREIAMSQLSEEELAI